MNEILDNPASTVSEKIGALRALSQAIGNQLRVAKQVSRRPPKALEAYAFPDIDAN